MLSIQYDMVKISADKNIDDTVITAAEVLGKCISFLFKIPSAINPAKKSIKNKKAIK